MAIARTTDTTPTPRPSGFTSLQKFGIVALVLAFLGGAGYFLGTTYGGTQLAMTLTTNANLERGLVGHYTFDGKDIDWSSTTAEIRDRSGNGNHGNATSTLTATSSPIAGVLGQALTYKNGDEVSASVPQVGDTYAITLSFWANVPTWSASDSELVDLSSFTEPVGIRLQGDYGGELLVRSQGNAERHDRIYAHPTTNTWHHYVVLTDMELTGQNEVVGFYLDGQLQTPTGSYTGMDNTQFYPTDSIYHFMGGLKGSLDDVRLYSRALSAGEVNRLYELGR